MISFDFNYTDYYYENKLDELLGYEYDNPDSELIYNYENNT